MRLRIASSRVIRVASASFWLCSSARPGAEAGIVAALQFRLVGRIIGARGFDVACSRGRIAAQADDRALDGWQ